MDENDSKTMVRSSTGMYHIQAHHESYGGRRNRGAQLNHNKENSYTACTVPYCKVPSNTGIANLYEGSSRTRCEERPQQTIISPCIPLRLSRMCRHGLLCRYYNQVQSGYKSLPCLLNFYLGIHFDDVRGKISDGVRD